jgi:hypothetical protein
VDHAERAEAAADSVAGKTLEAITEDKKAAQRALSAALRANAPEAQIARLKAAIRTIQRAESKAQRDQVAPASTTRTNASPEQTVIHVESGYKGAWSKLLGKPPADAAIIVDNRIVYETDSLARTVRAQIVLDQVIPKELRKSAQEDLRNGYAQGKSGGPDRLPGDQGGHIFGLLLGGPGERININAMLSEINQKSYRKIEIFWENEIESDRVVDVAVDIGYPGESMRADSFTIVFGTDDGSSHRFRFEQ